MRKSRWLLGTFAALVATGAAREASLESVTWMAGCWEIRAGERVVEEQWMGARGSVMLGMSRTTVGGETREYEHSVIRVEGERLVFAARPSGQEPTEFASTLITADSVVFANPEHDFPRTISYRTAARGDSLIATISGPLDGSLRAFGFRYGRVACAVRR